MNRLISLPPAGAGSVRCNRVVRLKQFSISSVDARFGHHLNEDVWDRKIRWRVLDHARARVRSTVQPFAIQPFAIQRRFMALFGPVLVRWYFADGPLMALSAISGCRSAGSREIVLSSIHRASKLPSRAYRFNKVWSADLRGRTRAHQTADGRRRKNGRGEWMIIFAQNEMAENS